MEKTLRPCPFCGAEAEIVRNGSGSYFVRCADKQCAAKTRLYHENENGARLAWNRRADLIEQTCDRNALLALADTLGSASGELCDGCALKDGCAGATCALGVAHEAARHIREALGVGDD